MTGGAGGSPPRAEHGVDRVDHRLRRLGQLDHRRRARVGRARDALARALRVELRVDEQPQPGGADAERGVTDEREVHGGLHGTDTTSACCAHIAVTHSAAWVS